MPLGEFKKCDTCGLIFQTDHPEDNDTCEDCVRQESEPQDEDLITKDYIRFYRYGFNHKGPCVVVADPEEGWQEAVKRYMDRTSYWPDIWLEEERGGYTNITMEGP